MNLHANLHLVAFTVQRISQHLYGTSGSDLGISYTKAASRKSPVGTFFRKPEYCMVISGTQPSRISFACTQKGIFPSTSGRPTVQPV